VGGFAAVWFSRDERRRGGFALAPVGLYVWHTAMVLAYYKFSQSSAVDATMFDLFLLYGLSGYAGLIFFLRSAQMVTGSTFHDLRWVVYALAFLPGLSFWSSAIGKDALMFMAIQMFLYGLCRLSRAWLWCSLGFLLALAIRPHVA